MPGLVLQLNHAKAAGQTDERLAENQMRPAGQPVEVLLAMAATPLVRGRALERPRTLSSWATHGLAGYRHEQPDVGSAAAEGVTEPVALMAGAEAAGHRSRC